MGGGGLKSTEARAARRKGRKGRGGGVWDRMRLEAGRGQTLQDFVAFTERRMRFCWWWFIFDGEWGVRWGRGLDQSEAG